MTTLRIVVAFFVGIVTAGVVAGLGVLIVQDTQSEPFTFLGTTLYGDKGVVVAGAVALGFVLAMMLLLPGWLASTWHRAHIRRQTRALEEGLRALREEYAQLHGGHQRLVEEHGLVLNRVLPSPPSPTAARVPVPPPAGKTLQTAPVPVPQAVPQAVPQVTDERSPDVPVAVTAEPTGALSR